MARPRRYATNAERQQAYRLRQAAAGGEGPERIPTEGACVEPDAQALVQAENGITGQEVGLTAGARIVADDSPRGPDLSAPAAPLSEQEIKDLYGYAASETRTQAQRQAVADRILLKGAS